MDVKLTIYNDEKRFFSGKISLPCVIGRGKQCDLSILQPLISRKHCELYEEQGGVCVRDLGSLNGTFYRDSQIGRGVRIPFGGFFTVAKLSFKIDEWEETGTEAIPTEKDEKLSFEKDDPLDNAYDDDVVDLEKLLNK